MLEIKVTDVPGFDGTYEWDPARQFNGHELHIIKKVSGVRLGEIDEAVTAGDYDVIVAITAIMIWRDGRIEKRHVPGLVDALLDAEGGKIMIEEAAVEEADREAVEDDPPVVPLSEPVSSSGEPISSSGPSSKGSSSIGDDRPETTLRAIGLPG